MKAYLPDIKANLGQRSQAGFEEPPTFGVFCLKIMHVFHYLSSFGRAATPHTLTFPIGTSRMLPRSFSDLIRNLLGPNLLGKAFSRRQAL